MICINQVGYRPRDEKNAVASGTLAGQAFAVVNEQDETVLTGVFGAPMHDAATDADVCHGAFTALTQPGVYTIQAMGERSYPFRVAEDVYISLQRDVLRMLYMQRCGEALPDALAGDFAHPACHAAPARIWGTEREKQVWGGWHDAGDYGRYVVPGAKTIADMLLLWELHGDSPLAMCDDLNIPESGNGVPDLLDEARFELEWFLRMQDEDTGAVYHKVSCHRFPGFVMPEDETEPLVISPISDAATADFAAVMFKAAVDYRRYDAAFADCCLQAGERAWHAVTALDELTGFVNPPDVHTGSYSDRNVADELFYAAAARANCLRALGLPEDPRAAQVIAQAMAGELYPALGWADMTGYALFELALAGNRQARRVLLDGAEKVLESMATDGYFCTLGTNYHWGSNMEVANHGMLLMLCDRLSPDVRYRKGAKAQLDVLLGVNGMNFSYVSGHGTDCLAHPHHRPSGFKGHAVPGMLSGGPNRHIQDDYARKTLQGRAPALCFVDHAFSYSTNEIAIYWNSPLIFLAGCV